MKCQNDVSMRQEANITDLAEILSDWVALCGADCGETSLGEFCGK